ncbi:putative Ig domain-containing protein [Parasediminibacterium sp. JCM 36343]|uniref:putative Ig domain-containing protein n=1 Tax=Parasediminibacterium sp. JCM 36343 TaxID=3374279 RepID=UPI00397992F3
MKGNNIFFCLSIATIMFITGNNYVCGQYIEVNDSIKSLILTPVSSLKPRINGAKVFGARPGSPFLYHIPVSGKRPMQLSVKGLPTGLKLDTQTGNITGVLTTAGTYTLVIKAKNTLGTAERNFKIIVGNDIALTPPMGWNSYNCWGINISQEKAMISAKAFISAHLDEHGWAYINLDDGWQGERGGTYNAIQPDPKKFSSLKAFCDSLHGLGLKAGIYSTPWTKSYGGRIGGSSNNADGTTDSSFKMNKAPRNKKMLPYDTGKYSFANQDARQWAEWGIDYLKYDWAPVEAPSVIAMDNAIRATKRDIILSLSNNDPRTLINNIKAVAPFAQSWRTTGDINDSWKNMSNIGFSQDKWASYSLPGHFNDPDMLVVGYVGWGRPHRTKLTPDEQYTHISLWSLLSAPLLLGCDLDKLDAFTLNLITNDEVIDIDQDILCKPAKRVYSKDSLDVFAKPLEDGSLAVGLFNRSKDKATITANWNDLGIEGKQQIRDVWRQKDVTIEAEKFETEVASHGVVLLKITKINLNK